MRSRYLVATGKPAFRSRRVVVTVWGASALIAASALVAHAAGLRVNATPSMPLGLWRLGPVPGSLRAGEIVVVCPPDSAAFREALDRGYMAHGACPAGYEPLIKPVAAVAGDLVMVAADGVAVNGEPVPGTAPLARDTAGRPLLAVPVGSHRVASGELWLLSGHVRESWDSRYFGAVPAAGVQGVARPVWVVQ